MLTLLLCLKRNTSIQKLSFSMKKELLTTLCLAFATQSPLFAQEDAPKWMRWSAISPDGKNIAFSAYGDIYLVESGSYIKRGIACCFPFVLISGKGNFQCLARIARICT